MARATLTNMHACDVSSLPSFQELVNGIGSALPSATDVSTIITAPHHHQHFSAQKLSNTQHSPSLAASSSPPMPSQSKPVRHPLSPTQSQDSQGSSGHGFAANPRPFPCQYGHCRRTFDTADQRDRHHSRHAQHKPHACRTPGCDLAFTSSYHRDRHERVHSGERPFQCKFPHCQKRFSQSGGLHRHARTHDRPEIPTPLACTHCARVFPRVSELLIHQWKTGCPANTSLFAATTDSMSELTRAGHGDGWGAKHTAAVSPPPLCVAMVWPTHDTSSPLSDSAGKPLAPANGARAFDPTQPDQL